MNRFVYYLFDLLDTNPVRAVLLVCLILAVFMGGLLIAVSLAYSADATVSWTHPTQRENNVALPLSEIAETRVLYGLCANGTLPGTVAVKVVPAPTATTVIPNLGYGTWCFAAQTADTGGLVSANSSIQQKVVLAPPKPPVLSATITVVYEITPSKWDGVRLGRNVGTILKGTPCLNNPIMTNKGEFYEVSLDLVKLTQMPKSAIVVTKCEFI